MSTLTTTARRALREFTNGELADMLKRQHDGHPDWKHPYASDLEPLLREEAFKRVGALDMSTTYEDWESLHGALVRFA